MAYAYHDVVEEVEVEEAVVVVNGYRGEVVVAVAAAALIRHEVVGMGRILLEAAEAAEHSWASVGV